MTPVNKADGSTCTGDEEILELWHEHYDQALNHPSGTACVELDAASLSSLPSPDICTDEPTFDEGDESNKEAEGWSSSWQ